MNEYINNPITIIHDYHSAVGNCSRWRCCLCGKFISVKDCSWVWIRQHWWDSNVEMTMSEDSRVPVHAKCLLDYEETHGQQENK
jgi:hypothetical protein